MKQSTLALLICVEVCLCACNQTPEKVSALLGHEDEITGIIAGMTLEEKVNMLHGKHMFSSAGVERLGIPDIEYADGPFGIREELEPDGWNSLHLTTDFATFFPTGSALAATWSTEMAYKYGEAMAAEARLRGKYMILGPAINIQRIPTGGRTYEYFSEDPLLSGELAVSYTLGAQDHDEAVCLKHYALNNQENMRGFVDVQISERAMREIYLAPFEAAVKEADAYGIMAAYNKVGGYWCSENDMLLNKILRDEWGFKGIVISDWGGTHSTVGAAMGGLDVEMPDERYMGEALLDSVKAGIVPEAVIDAKVRNLLRVRMAIPPVPKEEANVQMTSQPAGQQTAYEVASRSIVLLKNSGVLPISGEVKKIAVIGENAVRHMASGGMGAGVKALYEITPLEGLEMAYEGSDVTIKYAQGYVSQGRIGHGSNQDRQPSPAEERALQRQSEQLAREAVALAKDADLVIFVGGDNREVETEGSDRKDITLPSRQDELIARLAQANPNIVSVMVVGAPVDLRTVAVHSAAILISWFNGSEGGHALADVLTGNIAPSGKLPFTFPAKLEDVPAYSLGVYPQEETEMPRDVFVNLVNKDNFEALQKAESDYAEGILVGYRWYATKNVAPLYPFGHGLSYTLFIYGDAQANATKDQVDVTFTLTNAGKMDAEEVAQVYVTRPESAIERPALELKGFQRVALKAGESKQVTISIPKAKLCHWDEQLHAWTLEEGPALFRVGASSVNLPSEVEINLTKK
ncbi:MAG: glycoside hydrolase family 3 C-terminal domain-containing protein [Prevotellaceae bacterium]|nr:glycoside hydrolase family 3 C-terminal domain-containing protein [Prevotellaceae bacterium]